ncbi:MAG: IPT/TIG domain-containing protein, partial [Prosthecobacter sp.]|nr:IPT/TIG domain-containing protein [Prosthecobacter sp.]
MKATTEGSENPSAKNSEFWRHGLHRGFVFGATLFAHLILGMSSSVLAGGLTLLTHGFQKGDDIENITWLDAMTNYVHDKTGNTGAVYELIVDKPGRVLRTRLNHIAGPTLNNSSNTSGEIVVKLIWADAAGLIWPFGDDEATTGQIAVEAFNKLMNWTDGSNPLASPIHLIGHSRGGSVVSEIARLLGTQGIWVDHMTTLDPRPVTEYPYPELNDKPMNVWETVNFADNYYEEDPLTFPNGESVEGAYNRPIYPDTLWVGGYSGLPGSPASHSDVHLWYHGTLNVDDNAFNGEQAITENMRQNWYWSVEGRGKKAGYYLSRLGSGAENRNSAVFYEGLYRFLLDFPVNRTVLVPRNPVSRTWPNIIEAKTSPLSAGRYKTEISYQDFDSQATLWIELDNDRNPNTYSASASTVGKKEHIASSGAAVFHNSVEWDTTNIRTGTYWVHTEIRDGQHSRHIYSPGSIQVVNSGVPPAIAVGPPAAPTSFIATPSSSNSISLAWNDNSGGVATFRIRRGTSSGGPWIPLVPDRPKGSTAFTNSSLSAETTYYYQIAAVNGTKVSDFSTPPAQARTYTVASANYTLTINSSNPASGVLVGSSNALTAGSSAQTTTPSIRSFPAGTLVNVFCLLNLPSGQQFQKWQLDGAEDNYNPAINVSLNSNRTVTAVFGNTAPVAHILTSLAIEGQSSVDEQSSATYKAKATYTDGSSGYVSASWSEDSSDAGILSSGVLDTDEVGSDQIVTVGASFTTGGVTRTATKDVTIRDKTPAATYKLTRTTTTGGSIGYNPQAGRYAEGTVVSLHGNADDDYVFSHWSGDASGTDPDIKVRMNGDRTVTANFTLDTSFGRMQVTLSPAQAVTEGAAWKYHLFTAWRPSGDLQDGITPRTDKYVFFKDIPGWITPDNLKASVQGSKTTVLSATYREILGGVQVTLSPSEVNLAGGRWRLDGGAWMESGVTVADVTTGGHTIEFQSVSGWAPPPNLSVSIERGVTATRNGDYVPPAGFPVVTAVYPRTGPITGGTAVTFEGANFKPGATVSFGGIAATVVTFESSTRITAVTPSRASYGTVGLSMVSGGQTVTQANGFSYLNPLGSNIELVGQIGGNVEAVAVVGNLAYYGEG